MIKKLLIISVFWGVLILALCSIPGNSLPKQPSIPYFDKLVHAGLYFIFSLFMMPLANYSKNKFISKFSFLLTLFIVGIYGGLIELAQERWFVGRSGDIIDFYSNLAGGLAGIISYLIFVKPLLQRTSIVK